MGLLEKTINICRQYGIKPSRSKGQNFLIDEAVYDRVVEAAELTSNDTVLEVGPGLGFMTTKLAARAGRVVAVELDDKLADYLRTALKAMGIGNVEVINDDVVHPEETEFLRFASNRRNSVSYDKVVANLPYNITSIFLRKFLSDAKLRPEMMVLMLQKEVAKRITATAGEMSLLAVSVQFYAEPEIVEYVPKNAFWPVPDVDSAIVKLKVKSVLPFCHSEAAGRRIPVRVPLKPGFFTPLRFVQDDMCEKKFFQMVKFGFSARRKMLKNNLAGGYKISADEAVERIKEAGFSEKIRAQDLSVDDWVKLLPFFE